MFWADIERAVELVRRQPPIIRNREFDCFEKATTPRGEPVSRMWFPLRVVRLATAVHLMEDEGCAEHCRNAAEEAAADHATAFARDALQAAAYRLQRQLGPLGLRLAALMGDKFEEQAEALAQQLEIEEWLRRDGQIGLTSDDAYMRAAVFGPQAVLTRISPWTAGALTEAAEQAEKLVAALPTPQRYERLQPAGDLWLSSWLAGDPLRTLSVIVLERLRDAPPSPAVGKFAADLLRHFS